MRSVRYRVFVSVSLFIILTFIVHYSIRHDSSRPSYRIHAIEKVAKPGAFLQSSAEEILEDSDSAVGRNGTSYRTNGYPPRKDMGSCPKLYGKVSVLIAYVESSMKTHYKVAQETMQCYLKGTDYELFMVDLMNDTLVRSACGHHNQLFFLKHCAVELYLNKTDWMYVLDADTGVANPNHCLEEYIDDRVDLLFYERMFNYEIASGNYIARNTPFVHDFLKKWSNIEFTQPNNWNGADNGALQIMVLKAVIPDAIQEHKNCDNLWHQGVNFETYMNYVTCCKIYLGANRLWPEKIRIYRRSHGWVRDGFVTSDAFCDFDFMFHGWKNQKVGDSGWESPFNANIDPSKCGKGVEGWDWRENKKISCEESKKMIAFFEGSSGRTFPKEARTIPYLAMEDIGACFPYCEENT